MGHLNVEIKARCQNQNSIREILKSKQADFKGIDHQIDTYFKVSKGRLKLREGNIENSLIFYERENKEGPKQSNVILFKTAKDSSLKEILTKLFEILIIVDKKREIYFISNVKFHIDEVKGLGDFIEIEAIDEHGNIGKEKLQEQCQEYIRLFQINNEDLISQSYSDLLLKN
jgi:predicted adenylyl cyclase CyaB